MPIQIGCQTYTWQMSGGVYDGRLDLATAIAMDAEFKCSATEDPDLQAMRDDLESIG